MTRTRSEELFERFLAAHELPFRPIERTKTATPDYLVSTTAGEIAFEVEQIDGDAPRGAVHSCIPGERVRQAVKDSKRQIQPWARKGVPAVLLLFNNHDPMQLFQTEDNDFERGMYGEDTLVVDVASGRPLSRLHGKNKSLQRSKNTSFSALGRLSTGSGEPGTVTLFENMHARVAIDYRKLQRCFDVVRARRVGCGPLAPPPPPR